MTTAAAAAVPIILTAIPLHTYMRTKINAVSHSYQQQCAAGGNDEGG